MKDNLVVSMNLSKIAIKMADAEDGACFSNAFLSQIFFSAFDYEPIYVEGYALVEDVPLVTHHAWVELEGRIIEPTPAWLKHAKEASYFGVRRKSRDEMIGLARAEATLPLAGFGMMPSDFAKTYWTVHLDVLNFDTPFIHEALDKIEEITKQKGKK